MLGPSYLLNNTHLFVQHPPKTTMFQTVLEEVLGNLHHNITTCETVERFFSFWVYWSCDASFGSCNYVGTFSLVTAGVPISGREQTIPTNNNSYFCNHVLTFSGSIRKLSIPFIFFSSFYSRMIHSLPIFATMFDVVVVIVVVAKQPITNQGGGNIRWPYMLVFCCYVVSRRGVNKRFFTFYLLKWMYGCWCLIDWCFGLLQSIMTMMYLNHLLWPVAHSYLPLSPLPKNPILNKCYRKKICIHFTPMWNYILKKERSSCKSWSPSKVSWKIYVYIL